MKGIQFLVIFSVLLTMPVRLDCSEELPVGDSNGEINPQSRAAKPAAQTIADYVLEGSSLIRHRRQNGFNMVDTGANAGAQAGSGGAEAVADARAVGVNSEPGFKYTGVNTNSNSFGQNFGGLGYASGAVANSNAFGQAIGPNGGSTGAANAQAQAFQSGGAFGSFGTAATNTASQGQTWGPGGQSGSASMGASQTYKLADGKEISLSNSNSISFGGKGPSTHSG